MLGVVAPSRIPWVTVIIENTNEQDVCV
jgi:hypothetical protein